MAIPSPLQPIKVGNLVVHVGRWTGNWTARLGEVSTSATAGTRYAAVREDNSWEASFPLDDAAFPEVVGLNRGAIIPAIKFMHGVGVGDRLVATTVESVQKVCDNGADVTRVVVTGKGGDLTPNHQDA